MDQISSNLKKYSKLSKETIQHSVYSTGELMSFKKIKFDEKKYDSYIKAKCDIPEARLWNQDLCQQLLDPKCKLKKDCEISFYKNQCSVVFIEENGLQYIVTARHCTENQDLQTSPSMQVRYLSSKDNSIVEQDTEVTSLSQHYFPNDFSILKIKPNQKQPPIYSQIRKTDLNPMDQVYSIGFPYLNLRKNTKEDYDLRTGDMRVTFGFVKNANRNHYSFCGFSIENDIAQPEKWKLEKNCNKFNYSKLNYVGREERNPLLTDTDMTYSMSGSPLFDSNGLLIGIGSTILSSEPSEFSTKTSAVYVKAMNLLNYLPILKNEKKKE